MKNLNFKLLATFLLTMVAYVANAQDWYVCWTGSQQFTVDTNPALGSGNEVATGSPGSTYAWTISGGGTVTPANPANTTLFTSNGTPGDYTITATETNDCGEGTDQTFSVRVVKPDVSNITFTGGSCSTDDIVITITGTPGATVDYTVSSGTPNVPSPVTLDATGTATVTVANPAAGAFDFNVTNVGVSFNQPNSAQLFTCSNNVDIAQTNINLTVGVGPVTSPIIATP